MKTTIKQILILIIFVLISIGAYRLYTRQTPITQDPYEAKIQAIMDRPEFIKSVRLQAETVQAKEDKQAIEKKLEELRKAELELASSTKTSLK
jgi:hypothetical protein